MRKRLVKKLTSVVRSTGKISSMKSPETKSQPSRLIEIPWKKLEDIIISHLYATGGLNDSEEVTSMSVIEKKENVARFWVYLKD